MSAPTNTDQLKAALENISCLDHRTKPQVNISGNTMTIICCCKYFHADCLNVAHEMAELLTINNLTIR